MSSGLLKNLMPMNQRQVERGLSKRFFHRPNVFPERFVFKLEQSGRGNLGFQKSQHLGQPFGKVQGGRPPFQGASDQGVEGKSRGKPGNLGGQFIQDLRRNPRITVEPSGLETKVERVGKKVASLDLAASRVGGHKNDKRSRWCLTEGRSD